MDDAEQLQLISLLATANGSARDRACARLYHHYRPVMLRRFMGHREVDRAHAEALLHDVFLKVATRAGQCRESVSGWIWKIANNALTDLLVKLNADRAIFDALDDEVDLPIAPSWSAAAAVGPAQPGDVTGHDVDECVGRQLQVFERKHKRRGYALRLAALEQWSTEELAAYLGRNLGATREFIAQCRKKAEPFLRECWSLLEAKGA